MNNKRIPIDVYLNQLVEFLSKFLSIIMIILILIFSKKFYDDGV